VHHNTQRLLAALLLIALFTSACGSRIATEEDLHGAFQAALDDVVAKNDNVHNALLLVSAPDIAWKGAAGLADPGVGLAAIADDSFRSASSAKMMLATLTLLLSEEGLVDLDAPIARYLAPEIIEGLHLYEGHDYGKTLTTRHLMHHTSGLADNWFDERDEGRFLRLVLEEETDKLWQPIELVDYVKNGLPPLFAPGEGIHYSDVNFVLVGMVIEAATGQPLHDVYRERLFAPLGMEHTYLEFRETARPSVSGRGPAHVFFGEVDYTSFRSLSADWAGGGLVTTTEDMARFMRAYADNEIFAQPDSRKAMFDWLPWQGEAMDYGLGVTRINGKMFTVWGHLGVGQAFMLYWPDGDVVLCGTLNQDEADPFGGLLGPVLSAIKSYRK